MMTRRYARRMLRTLGLVVVVVVVVALAGCGGDRVLETDQGECTNLAEADCLAARSCQQVYIESGFSPPHQPYRCVLLEDTQSGGPACNTLDHDGCRGRNDCSPIYVQQLGPTDGPVGDPKYGRCEAEE